MKTIRKPVVHLYISGGCGNQFFQYAFARMVQETVGGELEINYNLIRKYKQNRVGNDNLLADFNVVDYKYKCKTDYGYLVFEALRFIRGVFRLKDYQKRTYSFYKLCAKFLPYVGIYYFDAAYFPFRIISRKNIYIRGYFECADYFKNIDDKIKHEVTSKHPILDKNREMFERIIESNSVCITIKRQDIENVRFKDVYTYDMSYFYTAVEYMKSRLENPVFFIFSDNIAWCKENFKLDGEIHYELDDNPIWEKVRLMSACKHFIIHNSTFSWWVQHLSDNPDKIVLAPTKWTQRDDQPIDIYEDNWMYIDNQGNIVKYHE